MKKLAFVVAAASLLAFAPVADRFGPLVSSVALVWLAVVLAVAASGSIQSIAIASGALGALGSGILGGASPAIAGAVLLAAAFAERTTRVRSRTARAVHLGVALISGAFAGALADAYAGAALPVTAVAAVVGAVLAALPLLVEADDPVAHALEAAARVVSEPARATLLEGAELRRTSADVPLERETAARVRKTWLALLRLAEARTRLEKSRPRVRVAEGLPGSDAPAADAVLAMVDQRAAEHVALLARAYSAVDTVNAAAASLDDTALGEIASMGDSLEDESRALVEVKEAAS
jgi:hypothetical protein